MSLPHYVVAIKASSKWAARLTPRLNEPPQDHYFRGVGFPKSLLAAMEIGPAPRAVFVVHWSERIPAEVYGRVPTVGFHAAPLPYGRGGSPVQNMMLADHDYTELCAYRMGAGLDDGPVLHRVPVRLYGRTAGQVFEDIAAKCAELIDLMARQGIGEGTPQQGEPVIFKRRRPAQSEVPPGLSPEALDLFIRANDAPGYPPAFVDADGYRVELTGTRLFGDRISAHARIKGLP